MQVTFKIVYFGPSCSPFSPLTLLVRMSRDIKPSQSGRYNTARTWCGQVRAQRVSYLSDPGAPVWVSTAHQRFIDGNPQLTFNSRNASLYWLKHRQELFPFSHRQCLDRPTKRRNPTFASVLEAAFLESTSGLQWWRRAARLRLSIQEELRSPATGAWDAKQNEYFRYHPDFGAWLIFC